MRRFQEKYVQSGPNVNTVILVFTKVYAERFFNFFASMGGQKGPVFYIYYEKITGYRSEWIFLLKGGFILPIYFSIYYEGMWRICL